MKKHKLIARKAQTYGTRRLRAGDTFEAPHSHARLLTAVGLASHAPAEAVSAAPAPARKPVAMKPVASHPDPTRPTFGKSLFELRSTLEELTGERPDMRWGAQRLEEEIAKLRDAAAAAEGKTETRDLLSED